MRVNTMRVSIGLYIKPPEIDGEDKAEIKA